VRHRQRYKSTACDDKFIASISNGLGCWFNAIQDDRTTDPSSTQLNPRYPMALLLPVKAVLISALLPATVLTPGGSAVVDPIMTANQ